MNLAPVDTVFVGKILQWIAWIFVLLAFIMNMGMDEFYLTPWHKYTRILVGIICLACCSAVLVARLS